MRIDFSLRSLAQANEALKQAVGVPQVMAPGSLAMLARAPPARVHACQVRVAR